MRVIQNERWLNQSVSGKDWFYFKTEPASDETRRKMSEYANNRTEEHQQKLRDSHKGLSHLTDKEWEDFKEKRKGNPNWWNEEHRKKIKEHNQTKAQDPEWRKRVSEGLLAYYDKVGRRPKVEKIYPETGYGKRKSEDHRKSISNSLKGKKKATKTCEYCNKTISHLNYNRWHGEKCKEKPKCQ